MEDRLRKYIEKTSLIKIYTDVEGDEKCYTGIPIRISRAFLAIHELADFHFDGYRIVRLKDIVKIRRSKFEITTQKILKYTGELDNHVSPAWLRIGSWKSLFKCLKERRICACAASGLIELNIFRIGEIYRVGDTAVTLNSFDAHAQWYKPKDKIEYSKITEVSFGDEYSVTFNNFIKSCK